jgi:hypothetical protein
MVQRRGGLGLPLESAESLRVSGHVFRQELEGDKAAELHVFGLVDHAHAPAPEPFEDAVMRDGPVDQRIWADRVARHSGKMLLPLTLKKS